MEEDVWYRCVMLADVSNKKWNLSIYRLGTEQPGLDTPTPAEALVTRSNLAFYRDDLKPLSVIALTVHRPRGGSSNGETIDEIEDATLFDNVRIRYGATAQTLELCYENDFTTRRYRRAVAFAGKFPRGTVAARDGTCYTVRRWNRN